MKQCVLLLLACVCTHGAPLEPGMVAGSCQDSSALAAAELSLTKINKDRHEGYVFKLFRLNNVNQIGHGETGIVFYLTLDVLETKCHVLTKKNSESCRLPASSMLVYGQCKAAIYINKPHRVVRLYNYNCVMRPVSKAKGHHMCGDCPAASDKEDQDMVKVATLSTEKFNKDHGLANHFTVLNITQAFSSWGGSVWFRNVEYTIQETTCANTTDPAQVANCPLMGLELVHKGFCEAREMVKWDPVPDDPFTVKCQVFEPESAEHKNKTHHYPEGSVRVLPALDHPMTLPAFPFPTEKGVTLPLVQDPEIPGEREPTILPFPSAASPQCPAPFNDREYIYRFMNEIFAEDPLFKAAV